ncbi:ATPase, T2SS/T4P/T4SS family [Anaerovorax odorimutans]|uniref:ATPase, T2SS/T4P/T4SS family n=2 Tax=Anaerovorax odorimutans TaxID=109327 RepID=A0ABT1RS64_9FIRM|nr:type II/IV secretion system protein [Anaerovorax odorimutans]MCQ4638018.1 ATPase, T2SS/T4P/T4SS family [Anaerovorax odorimutans]
MKNVRIGDVLIEHGYIDDQQLRQALEYQSQNKGKRLGSILMEMGFVTEHQMLDALGHRMELPVVDISGKTLETEAVSLIPRQVAQKYELIAVEEKDGILTVAMSDPLNFYAVEDVRQITQKTISVVLDVSEHIKAAIDRYYSEIVTKQAFQKVDVVMPAEELAQLEPTGDEAPIVQALNNLLVQGYRMGASDIHIEPFKKHIQVRMRVDGVITEIVKLAPALQLPLVARIKILSGMDIAERRLPQDGHFQIRLEDMEINTRVSIVPTVFGEKAVIRFLYTNVVVDQEQTYGMTEENYEKFRSMISSPHGIIYITGPTGSGKTTTLYMVLEQVARKAVNVSTIEDPVERNLPQVNQVQVNNTAGLTFDVGLKALLRQDPDVIMVGETRDSETASISVRAAITGHQVFSTLHTNDAISSIVRLRDMGIPSYMVANSLVGLVAQRLMRKVCPHCGETYQASPAELKALGLDIDEKVSLRKGAGCSKCNHTGYMGRRSIHEMVLIDKAIRKMITEEVEMSRIRHYLRTEQNFKSLYDAARTLTLQGITTMEEFYKIAYYAEEDD